MDWSAPGPLRAFRDHYVAPYAGVSYDLAPGVVGVDPAYLQNAAELPGRTVVVTHDALPRTSILKRPAFVVVALTHLMRDARRIGAEGGLVFSSFDLDDPDAAPVLETLAPGRSVFMNAALSRLPDAAVKRPALN